MATWAEFASSAPELATAGERLLRQFGIGLGFLATIRKDGGPRLHPVCPVLTSGSLYMFVGKGSPKLYDLLRDGRYAMHSFPPAEGDDEFFITGRAKPVADPAIRSLVSSASDGLGHDWEVLFEFGTERAMHTVWHNPRHPDMWPSHTRWREGEEVSSVVPIWATKMKPQA